MDRLPVIGLSALLDDLAKTPPGQLAAFNRVGWFRWTKLYRNLGLNRVFSHNGSENWSDYLGLGFDHANATKKRRRTQALNDAQRIRKDGAALLLAWYAARGVGPLPVNHDH